MSTIQESLKKAMTQKNESDIPELRSAGPTKPSNGAVSFLPWLLTTVVLTAAIIWVWNDGRQREESFNGQWLVLKSQQQELAASLQKVQQDLDAETKPAIADMRSTLETLSAGIETMKDEGAKFGESAAQTEINIDRLSAAQSALKQQLDDLERRVQAGASSSQAAEPAAPPVLN